MNLTQLENAVKRYGFDDSDPLTDWINAALFDLTAATDWPWLESYRENILSGSGLDTITMPTDMAKVISVRDRTNQRKLEYMSRKQFERDVIDPTFAGKPENYTLVGSDGIQLFPVPDGIYTIDVYYAREIPALANGADEPDIPDRLHYTIVLGAVRYALTAESEEERAKAAESLYNDAIGRAMTFYGLRELDDPSTVVDTAGYTDDGA